MNDAQYDGEEPADEVMQDETPDLPAVRVTVDTPVNVRELPSIGAGAGVWLLDTSGSKVLAADPRRKLVTLVSRDQDIYLGPDQGSVDIRTTQGGAGTPTGAWWPAGVPIVVQHGDELWVSSVTSTTRLSVIPERWTH